MGRSRINYALLSKVAKITEETPPDQFDMGNWAETRKLPESNLCKTVGCAVGNAAIHRVFKGIVPVFIPVGEGEIEVDFQTKGSTSADFVVEARSQLGLTDWEFDHLFTSRAVMDLGPRQVATRIRKFIQDKKAGRRVRFDS